MKSWWQYDNQLYNRRCPMAGENGKKKVFDREFKVSAVKMVTDGGHKAAEVARSLGIHPNQLL
jgi:transposase-like protein